MRERHTPHLRAVCDNRVEAMLNGHIPQFDGHISRTKRHFECTTDMDEGTRLTWR